VHDLTAYPPERRRNPNPQVDSNATRFLDMRWAPRLGSLRRRGASASRAPRPGGDTGTSSVTAPVALDGSRPQHAGPVTIVVAPRDKAVSPEPPAVVAAAVGGGATRLGGAGGQDSVGAAAEASGRARHHWAVAAAAVWSGRVSRLVWSPDYDPVSALFKVVVVGGGALVCGTCGLVSTLKGGKLLFWLP
jgi:hypothetical protein